jgi:hypothetical protein
MLPKSFLFLKKQGITVDEKNFLAAQSMLATPLLMPAILYF